MSLEVVHVPERHADSVVTTSVMRTWDQAELLVSLLLRPELGMPKRHIFGMALTMRHPIERSLNGLWSCSLLLTQAGLTLLEFFL